MKRFPLLLLIIAAIMLPVHAQGKPGAKASAPPAVLVPGQTLRVATRVLPPFVTQESGEWRGFSIDLWRSMAAELGVKTEFVQEPTVKELLASVTNGKADVAIAAISITSEREKALDFSQPMLDGGLQILVPAATGSSATLWQLMTSSSLMPLIAALPFLVLVPAHIIWLIERRSPNSFIEDKRYLPGIGKAMWWAAGTIGAQADEMPRSPVGRFVAIVMMFVGVAFVAFFTAALTSALTVQQLRGDIQGPEDLPGKRVATTANSTADAYLRKSRARVVTVPTIEKAYQALAAKQVEAVVFDAPVLMYYAANGGNGRVQVVGPLFNKEDYGIALRTGSPLRKPINGALLSLQESGAYQALYDKWFGKAG